MVLAAFAGQVVAQDAAWRSSVAQWRQAHETALQADDGWLTVAGLFWLKSGQNPFGTDRSNAIVLPEGSAPGRAGTLIFEDTRAIVEAAPGVRLLVNGTPIARTELRADKAGRPDTMSLGRLTMFLIQRGDRYGLRLRDPENPRRRSFKGLAWFPIREAYRVTGRLVAAPPGRTVPIVNVLGQVEQMPSPGTVVFTLGGHEYRLVPVLESVGSRRLFFIFRDKTSGRDTYGAGRFLYADWPVDGRVVLDFNRAENPPCAFTDFATCPLPPPQNSLPIAIQAGEQYRGHT
jgi:uncharacterized protein (DUF1684 family)